MLKHYMAFAIVCSIAALAHAAGSKVVVPNAQDFNKQISSMNACYLSSKTDCNGVDMSQYYWSNDPNGYWKEVNQSLNSSNPWASNAVQTSTPTPAPAPTLTTTQTPTPTMTENQSQTYLPLLPPAQENTDAGSTGGFIIG
jgi:hypothetical protein